MHVELRSLASAQLLKATFCSVSLPLRELFLARRGCIRAGLSLN